MRRQKKKRGMRDLQNRTENHRRPPPTASVPSHSQSIEAHSKPAISDPP